MVDAQTNVQSGPIEMEVLHVGFMYHAFHFIARVLHPPRSLRLIKSFPKKDMTR